MTLLRFIAIMINIRNLFRPDIYSKGDDVVSQPELHDNTSNFKDIRNIKYIKPEPPLRFIERNSIYPKLNSLHKKKLITVTAPTGYGKTTLVSLWCSRNKSRFSIAWLSLEASDNNLQIFWDNIAGSIENGMPSAGLKLFTGESVSLQPANAYAKLVLGFIAGLNTELVLVLDDFHEISDINIFESFQYFISHMPKNLHIIIVSRKSPQLQLGKMRVCDEISEVGTGELSFAPAEIEEFCRRILRLDPTPKEISEIEAVTEGWPAALRLITLLLQDGNSLDMGRIRDISRHSYFIEYLTQEVYNKQGAAARDFLLKTSILDELNPGLCDMVAGIDNSIDILEDFYRGNVFLTNYGKDTGCYRYHTIISGFLRKKLESEYPGSISGLYLQASKWYAENGLYKAAIDYSIKAGSHSETARLIELLGGRMLIHKEFKTIMKLTALLPKAILLERPRLCIIYIFANVLARSIKTEEEIIEKLGINIHADCFSQYHADFLVLRSFFALHANKYQEAIELSLEALEGISGGDYASIIAYDNLIYAYTIEVKDDEAEECLRRQTDMLIESNWFSNEFIVFFYKRNMARLKSYRGKRMEAKELYGSLIDMLSAGSFDSMSPLAVHIYLFYADVCLESFELEAAYRYFKKGIWLSNTLSDVHSTINGYSGLAEYMQLIGKNETAYRLIDKCKKMLVSVNSRFAVTGHLIELIRTPIAAGYIEYARYLLDLFEIKSADSYNNNLISEYIALADYANAVKDYPQALQLLSGPLDTIRGTNNFFLKVPAFIQAAIAHWNLGDRAAALEYLSEVLHEAYGNPSCWIFMSFKDIMLKMLIELIKRKEHIAPGYSNAAAYAQKLVTYMNVNCSYKDGDAEDIAAMLSKRETEILKYISAGYTNGEIAKILFIAESTVKKHINSLYCKINAANRTEAIAFANRFLKIST